jgi:hypothetical protein
MKKQFSKQNQQDAYCSERVTETGDRLRKKVILIMVVLLNVCMTYAQQNLELNLDKSSGRTLGEFFKELRSKSHTGLGIGYQHVSFFNSLYYNNIASDVIKNKGGFEIVYFINIAPVIFDLGYFSSTFDVNSDMYYPDYSKKLTLLQGMEAYLSYAPLLPDWGKFSETVQPYAGIGIQTSSLEVSDESDSDSSETIASYGTTSPMWKGGVKINLGVFFIKGEYKQALSVSKSNAFNVLSVCAGIQF